MSEKIVYAVMVRDSLVKMGNGEVISLWEDSDEAKQNIETIMDNEYGGYYDECDNYQVVQFSGGETLLVDGSMVKKVFWIEPFILHTTILEEENEEPDFVKEMMDVEYREQPGDSVREQCEAWADREESWEQIMSYSVTSLELWGQQDEYDEGNIWKFGVHCGVCW